MAFTFTEIDAHVRAKYIPTLVDQVFITDPFLLKMLSQNQVKFDSGVDIRQPVIIGKLNGGAYKGLDKFNISAIETDNMAKWEWKGVYVNVTLTGDDLDKVEGDEKIISLVQSKMENARMTMNDMLSTMLFGTATSTDKEFEGLTTALDSGTYATYGNISKSDVPEWISGGDQGPNTTGGAATLSMIKKSMGYATFGTEKPDLIITTQTIYDSLWAQVQPYQRKLSESTTLGKFGYSGIQIDDCQILVDRHCPSGYVYGLNTKYWKLIIHKKKAFKWTDEKVPIDADAYVRQLLVKGNFICTSRRMQFLITNVT